jgi:guanylate kinase
VSGPSGAGKGTLLAEVLRARPDLWFSVSATTRKPRPGEREGREYFFVSRAQFETWIADDALLEWAQVYDEYYGTPRDPIARRRARGCSVVLDIDTQGAFQVMQRVPDAISIFIEPPSLAELAQRLKKRGTEDEQQLQLRLEAAEHEMRRKVRYTYTLVNENIARSAEALLGIINAVSPPPDSQQD